MFCLLKCSIVFYLGDHVSSYIGPAKVLQQSDSVEEMHFDFKKAFDSVPHERLLVKLNHMESRAICCTTFLTNREQRVVVN